LWDEQRTPHLVKDYLECRGVTIPSGWTLTSCTDVVENAGVLTFCGDATNPSGDSEGWIARCEGCSCWTTYCTAKGNSLGCTPSIDWSGCISLTGPDDFHITTSDVIPQTNGQLLWGLYPSSGPPPPGTSRGWHAFDQPLSFVCLVVARSEFMGSSGGTAGLCDGSFDFHFSQAYMGAYGFAVGTTVYAEFIYVDPNHQDGSGVGHTNALEFQICP
jgi:hypothetical protein